MPDRNEMKIDALGRRFLAGFVMAAIVWLPVVACDSPHLEFPTATPGSALLPEAQPGPNWQRVVAPGWSDQAGFSVMLPPGWKITELQGVDSYVGEITGEGVRLMFDYGSYSWSLNPEDEPEHEYVVAYEEIGERRGKLLVAKDSPSSPTASYKAATGVYFGGLEDGYALNAVGRGLTSEQQEMAVAIFRSIRIPE